MNLLEVRNLHLTFYDTEPPLEVVRDISFSMKEGEILGLVGNPVPVKPRPLFQFRDF